MTIRISIDVGGTFTDFVLGGSDRRHIAKEKYLTMPQDPAANAIIVKDEYRKSRLLEPQERHAVVGDVRGRGLLLGIEFVKERHHKTPAEAEALAITQRCLDKGLVSWTEAWPLWTRRSPK